MKDENMYNDALLRKLFKNSSQPVPFNDMEDCIMQRIENETTKARVLSRDKKLSFFFFIAGTALGLVLNSFLQKVPSFFPAIPSTVIVLVFQLAFALFFLIKLESFLKLFTGKRITG